MMNHYLKSAIFFLIFSVCNSAHAIFVPSGDIDYHSYKTDDFHLIFHKQYLPHITSLEAKIRFQIEAINQFKERKPYTPPIVLLIGPKSQISNAFATIYPTYLVGMYPALGLIGPQLSMSEDPFSSIFLHELNHIHQLSHSRGGWLFKNILKAPSLIYYYLFFPYPNIVILQLFLEGDATYKESLTQNGGRLYSGNARAFVYSQIKHFRDHRYKFKNDILKNTRLTTHSSRAKYQHGAYLLAMLAKYFPHKVINSFFKVNKKKPGKSFRKDFKRRPLPRKLTPEFGRVFSFRYSKYFFNDLTNLYFYTYYKEARKQNSSVEPTLFKSSTCPPFNESGEEVLFLTSDLKSSPTLRIYNKKSKTWAGKKTDLPLGKVFKRQGTYYSRASGRVAPYTTHFSLFSSGRYPLPEYDSKFVEDFNGKNILYISAKNTLSGNKLYLNDTFYTVIHSNALFDQYGHIYYFKQKGKVRTLYKNKKKLFSFPGYYGHLLEVDRQGTIYFTGASLYGSSVYQYNKKEGIKRSLSSDTVLQARKVSETQFLTCEVTPHEYEYKIQTQKVRAEQPVLYKYNFKDKHPPPLILKEKTLLSSSEAENQKNKKVSHGSPLFTSFPSHNS